MYIDCVPVSTARLRHQLDCRLFDCLTVRLYHSSPVDCHVHRLDRCVHRLRPRIDCSGRQRIARFGQTVHGQQTSKTFLLELRRSAECHADVSALWRSAAPTLCACRCALAVARLTLRAWRCASPAAVVREYDHLISEVRQLAPNAHIYISAIPPRKGRAHILEDIAKVNTYLSNRGRRGDNVTCMHVCPTDFHHFCRDKVHFNDRGRKVYGVAMASVLKRNFYMVQNKPLI